MTDFLHHNPFFLKPELHAIVARANSETFRPDRVEEVGGRSPQAISQAASTSMTR